MTKQWVGDIYVTKSYSAFTIFLSVLIGLLLRCFLVQIGLSIELTFASSPSDVDIRDFKYLLMFPWFGIPIGFSDTRKPVSLLYNFVHVAPSVALQVAQFPQVALPLILLHLVALIVTTFWVTYPSAFCTLISDMIGNGVKKPSQDN